MEIKLLVRENTLDGIFHLIFNPKHPQIFFKIKLMQGWGMVVDLGFSLGFTHIVTGTGVLTDEAPAHPEQSVLSSSHYPDNTSAGTLVRMCHSSVGSLGTAREQFVPQRHRPRPRRRHHLL